MSRIDLSSRAAIEAQIESLITFLDEIDGDCDLEPLIGFGLGMHGLLEIDLEMDEADREPSLGWTVFEAADDGYFFLCCHRFFFDGDEDGGDAPEHDPAELEPCLGSLDLLDQTVWSAGGSADCEWEMHDDIADEEALAEALEHHAMIEAFRAADSAERRDERKRLWWKAVEKSRGRDGDRRLWRLGDPVKAIRIDCDSMSFLRL